MKFEPNAGWSAPPPEKQIEWLGKERERTINDRRLCEICLRGANFGCSDWREDRVLLAPQMGEVSSVASCASGHSEMRLCNHRVSPKRYLSSIPKNGYGLANMQFAGCATAHREPLVNGNN